ncbi:MAG TPA: Xaa-Pro dipeptidase, partial [Planctomycetes bacterium]|nr:Xaa-Pro dipeptidase [Planctomycetota bacterium]
PKTAASLDLPASAVEPAALLQRLDWDRGPKTPYEVESIRAACLKAALGHDAVREGVTRGQSEHLLHLAYLEASGQLGRECPYETIIAWDRHAATLHYPHKQRQEPSPGRTLLIDAGATCHGYASDITRTYLRPGSHPVFHEALLGMVQLQNTLVDTVQPGLPYLVLHEAAFRGVTELLCVLGILKVGAEEAFERRLAFPFFPHGLGHHLGLQVHDVGGKLSGPTGPPTPPPAEFPWLRTTRTLEAGHVVTIEPGLYFIPLLLNGYREGKDSKAFNWDLVDALIPSGGIRIEDDVLVTPSGVENLSRAFLDT